jgi:hypothetical protein
MKKVFVMMLMAVAFAMPSNAQIKFGLQAGLNMNNISGTSDVKGLIESRTGFFVGPTVKFTLPIIGLAVDASALYDQRQGKAKESDQTIKAQSIQIPINVRYGVGLGDLAEIFLFAGPQFGFNVGSDKTLYEQANVAKSTWTLKSSNFSLNVGLGATALSHLQLKLNYNFALGKTGEIEVENLANKTKEIIGGAKANTWQLSLAYFF